jgi:hypothetical protein
VQDVLVDARGRGDVRDDVDLALTADCFVSAIVGSRSFGSQALTPAIAVSNQFIDIFARGIRRPQSPTDLEHRS